MFSEDPLLKVGVIAMTLALALVIVAVAVSAAYSSAHEQAVASETEITAKSSAEPRVRGESRAKPWREKARSFSVPSRVTRDEANSVSSRAELKPGSSPAAEAGEASQPEPVPQLQTKSRAQPEPKQQEAPTVGESGWSRPTPQEIEAANAPRHYDMPPGAIMGLTIPSIGIYGAPVFDSAGPTALARGVAHLPDTSLPWSDTPQRNVYLAGHRMGFRGTWSRMIFYNLDKLGQGETVVLRDRLGRTYEYRVSETLLVGPTDQWITGQVRGRDMLTLQTCTPIPTFEKRLIVRADRL